MGREHILPSEDANRQGDFIRPSLILRLLLATGVLWLLLRNGGIRVRERPARTADLGAKRPRASLTLAVNPPKGAAIRVRAKVRPLPASGR